MLQFVKLVQVVPFRDVSLHLRSDACQEIFRSFLWRPADGVRVVRNAARVATEVPGLRKGQKALTD